MTDNTVPDNVPADANANFNKKYLFFVSFCWKSVNAKISARVLAS